MNYSFTPQQLADLIDDAFDMGKRYATEELNSVPDGTFKGQTPVYKHDNTTADYWTRLIEQMGGHGLSSIDAKRDMLSRHLAAVICNTADVQFDD